MHITVVHSANCRPGPNCQRSLVPVSLTPYFEGDVSSPSESPTVVSPTEISGPVGLGHAKSYVRGSSNIRF